MHLAQILAAGPGFLPILCSAATDGKHNRLSRITKAQLFMLFESISRMDIGRRGRLRRNEISFSARLLSISVQKQNPHGTRWYTPWLGAEKFSATISDALLKNHAFWGFDDFPS